MTKSVIWNQLKEVGFDSKQLKAVYDVSYQQASLELLQTILEQVGQGVNEDLGSQCGGSLQLNKNKEEDIEVSNNQLNAIWNYKIIQSSWHPDFYHMWMYKGEQDYWYFQTKNMVAEIKLQDLETKINKLKSKDSTKSIVIQDCGTWQNIFTPNDMELDKLLNSEYYAINRNKIMQQSLINASIHTQAIKQQELLKQWIEQNNQITEQCDNYKGISVEHCSIDNVRDSLFEPIDYDQEKIGLIRKDNFSVLVVQRVKYTLSTEQERINQAIANNTVHPYAAVLGGNTEIKEVSSEPLPGSVVLSFNYEQELIKLKSLSQQEFLKKIELIQHVKGFSSYYIPTLDVLHSYMTECEYTNAVKVDMNLDDEYQFNSWLKMLEIEDCFSEAGNYHFSQLQLTPKLSLFTALTNYTYLSNCFTYLATELNRFNVEANEWFSKISTAIFETWFDINYLIHKGYIKQPLPSGKDYVTMLQLINQVA